MAEVKAKPTDAAPTAAIPLQPDTASSLRRSMLVARLALPEPSRRRLKSLHRGRAGMRMCSRVWLELRVGHQAPSADSPFIPDLCLSILHQESLNNLHRELCGSGLSKFPSLAHRSMLLTTC